MSEGETLSRDKLRAVATRTTGPMAHCALLAFACVASACGSAGEKPSAAETGCTGLAPTSGTPVSGALTIGSGSPQRFTPSMDGDTTELIIGSQGGYMAVPLFRVDATLLGTDGVCTYLRVEAAVDGQEPQNYTLKMPDSMPSEQYWYFGTLPLFLSYEETGIVDRDCTYTAAFLDDGREADAQVTLRLVDDE